MLLQPNNIFAQHYRLTKLIGDGGFAYVWLAEDMRIEERCAIKIYKEHILTDGIMDEHRFRAIMRRLYNIDNPNILTPKDFGNDRGMLYYVMRYLRDGSISRYAGRMSEKDIWEFLKQTAAGLEHLHSRHLVHRDIKPANIMIDSDSSSGTVYKIADFDTAASVDYTKTRVDAGSQPYQAPECFDSSIAATDETKLDVWALGASVYELVTGVTPFGNFGGLSQGSGREIPAIQQNISRNLKNLIYSCLDPDPDNRPSAREIYTICNGGVAKTATVRHSIYNKIPDSNNDRVPSTNLNKVPNLVKVDPPPPNFWKPVIITLLCVLALGAITLFLAPPKPPSVPIVKTPTPSVETPVTSSSAESDIIKDETINVPVDNTHQETVENTTVNKQPEISPPQPPQYYLTVINGSGSGYYAAGILVTIEANAPQSDEVFDLWTGNTSSVANVTGEKTTFKMENLNATIIATYRRRPDPTPPPAPEIYILTVNSGSGNGLYEAGQQVSISADSPPEGNIFDSWEGDINGVANVYSPNTTYTMGTADARIQATYKQDPCSYNDLGRAADRQGNYAQAIQYFYQGAQQGCNLAMYNLGRYYAIGPGQISRNRAEARQWLIRACNEGVTQACDLLNQIN
ncbi:MAG: protein kinase [Tannerella sp.]|jgi:serine/threonine protein kinase|nr:protein kinase [Tannerella sp.]